MLCYCGSQKVYEKCCGPFLKGTAYPLTAEELMRSRYSAFVECNIPYLKKTLSMESQSDFSEADTKKWASQSVWKGLKILSTSEGQEKDQEGIVEFQANYQMNGEDHQHHEISKFKKDHEGHWVFVDGESPDIQKSPVVHDGPKIGRNDLCTCGSGKKYKKCCGK